MSVFAFGEYVVFTGHLGGPGGGGGDAPAFAHLLADQAGEELQHLDLVLHVGLLPPLFPLGRLPLPLEPLAQELLVPGGLLLPLLLQLRQEGPRLRKQLLVAMRQVLQGGLQSDVIGVAAGGPRSVVGRVRHDCGRGRRAGNFYGWC